MRVGLKSNQQPNRNEYWAEILIEDLAMAGSATVEFRISLSSNEQHKGWDPGAGARLSAPQDHSHLDCTTRTHPYSVKALSVQAKSNL